MMTETNGDSPAFPLARESLPELAAMETELGRIVERGAVDEVLQSPRHPYTQALLSAVPMADPRAQRPVIRLTGDLPSPATPPQGCHFHPRCAAALPGCRSTYPEAHSFSATHTAHCHLYV